MSSIQFLSKVTYETTNRFGPLFYFFPLICLYLMRPADMFLSTWRSEIRRGSPWLQSALLECKLQVAPFCWKVYGVSLYLAFFHAFAKLEDYGLYCMSKTTMFSVSHVHRCVCLLSQRISLSSHSRFMLIDCFYFDSIRKAPMFL